MNSNSPTKCPHCDGAFVIGSLRGHHRNRISFQPDEDGILAALFPTQFPVDALICSSCHLVTLIGKPEEDFNEHPDTA